MLEIGWTEIFIIAAVAIIVVGPKDLPKMLRQVGQAVGQVRRMATDFQGQFKEALKEAELDDLKKDFDSVRKGASVSGMSSALNPLKDAADDIKSTIEDAGKEPPNTGPPKGVAEDGTASVSTDDSYTGFDATPPSETDETVDTSSTEATASVDPDGSGDNASVNGSDKKQAAE